MLYVVNTDIEVEAKNEEAAEDLVLDKLAEVDADIFVAIRGVEEVTNA